MAPILVTGSAGFIGFHLSKKLLENGYEVIGIDNLNDYYDLNLKLSRIELLKKISKNNLIKFTLLKESLQDDIKIRGIFESYKPKIVFNLAAQAGVRYSIENPKSYIQSNIVGFSNILECCRSTKVENLIYASSSSVYGGNKIMPFKENQIVDHPVSLYAATKKSNELMAHSYSHLYNLPVTGLRFFTVYGPWGRPDMALFIFTDKILRNKPIEIFNHGDMLRDFTYIDDIIESLYRLKDKPANSENNFDYNMPDPSSSWAPHKIFNIGNSNPIKLMDYIYEIERALDKKAIKEYLPMQLGDVKSTSADTSKLEDWINFKPNTSIRDGVSKFVNWYKEYYSK
tara:strand:- start:24856 stop:25881 length:1026 start_codon:yes stop_codon:yes gene_type:complete